VGQLPLRPRSRRALRRLTQFGHRPRGRSPEHGLLLQYQERYPTAAHERHAKEVGLPAAKVEAILGGMPAAFDDEREQVVYEMAMVLSNARWVPRGLHGRAVKALGHVGVTDVIALMGHCTSIAMALAFYDVPDGATGMAR
jgi:4-carboxymuconolactone decarboxylase